MGSSDYDSGPSTAVVLVCWAAGAALLSQAPPAVVLHLVAANDDEPSMALRPDRAADAQRRSEPSDALFLALAWELGQHPGQARSDDGTAGWMQSTDDVASGDASGLMLPVDPDLFLG